MLYANCSSGLACIVFVRLPEGEQEFEVAAGKSVMVTDMTGPIENGLVNGEQQGSADVCRLGNMRTNGWRAESVWCPWISLVGVGAEPY